MSNKKIQINLDSFHLNKNSKTRKNREKKERPIIKPLITPSILKNKLLKRIKEHKNKEFNSDQDIRKQDNNLLSETKLDDNNGDTLKPSLVDKNDEDIFKYSDEFNDSMNYLQSLTKQKKIDQEKENYERNKQKKLAELQRKTIKNHNHNIIGNNNLINLDLPDTLKEEFVPLNTQHLTINMETPFYLNKKHNATPPYGILKGGTKPTYRDWNKTQKNFVVTDPNSAIIVDNKEITNRERRLQILKEKIKLKQLEEKARQKEKNISDIIPGLSHENSINKNTMNEEIIMTQNLIRPNIVENFQNTINMNEDILPINSNDNNISFNNEVNNSLNNSLNNPVNNSVNNENSGSDNFKEKIVGIKRKIKKTIKRRYTLGKSKLKKTVAVLLKDQGTRKRIITAHRDLKRKGMNDIRKYLREHNLIKLGSNAPNDVLRKLYETSMLTGEITNVNKDVLIHNFMTEDLTNNK